MFNKKTRHFLCSALAVSLSAAVLLTGCGSKTPASSSSKVDNSKKVTLKYYFRAPTVPADLQTVNDAMNKILEKKINADIQLICIANTDYLQKLTTSINAQEEFDLAFTASSAGYVSQAQKGAYKDLTKLLPTYAPKTWALFKSGVWDAAKVDGKIYGSINQQQFARQSAFAFNKDVISKYPSFDYTKVKTYADITPLFAMIKADPSAGDTSALSYGLGKTLGMNLQYSWGEEPVGTNSGLPGWVKYNDKTGKVFNQYATDEMKQVFLTMADWYQKGYIPKDALTRTTWNNAIQPMGTPGTYKPGGEAETATQFSWKTAVLQTVGSAFIPFSGITGTMTSVSATSKNPERAVEYIEEINNDKELYNLLCYGIEGTHYTKTSDTHITQADNSKYKPNMNWEFGNTFNAYLTGTQPDDYNTKAQDMNSKSPTSAFSGFVFDDTNVKTEEANVLAIVNQYIPSFGVGVFGAQTEAKIAEFNAALKTAGMDTLLTEEQKQLTAFLKK